MNNFLQKYFANLEDYLVDSAKLARNSSSQRQARGEGAEETVARVLESHLPTRAAITTHRQIIGADTEFGGKPPRPSYTADLIVYNEWTTIPNLLQSGFVLAESVYLALEVKAYILAQPRKSGGRRLNLRDAIVDAATHPRKLRSTRNQKKRLRPETTYFGNVRSSKELPLRSARTGMPTSGVMGILWGEESEQELTAEQCLNEIRAHLDQGDVQSATDWPDVIYVPHHFLAFKVIAEEDGKPTRVYRDEYPFLPERHVWPSSDPILVTADSGQRKIEYRYLAGRDSKPNLLYAFVFWLSQEILKFGIEVPDYHRYLLGRKDPRLDGREGAYTTEQGNWKVTQFSTKKDEWLTDS